MKVRELIYRLKDMPPDLEVCMRGKSRARLVPVLRIAEADAPGALPGGEQGAGGQSGQRRAVRLVGGEG